MKSLNLIKIALAGLFVVATSSQASLVTTTFDNGDSLTDWAQDRALPASFEIINNELVMSIDGGIRSDNSFAQTQGMKFDITGSTFLSVDMFIDPLWTNSERFAGIWGVGRNDANGISNYPILEFQGPGITSSDAGVRVYDSTIPGFTDVSALFNVGQFNTLAFQAADNGVQYFINGTMIYSETTSGTTSFGEVILNAKNDGNSFDVRYDNLVFGVTSVSTPAAFALLSMGVFGIILRRRKA